MYTQGKIQMDLSILGIIQKKRPIRYYEQPKRRANGFVFYLKGGHRFITPEGVLEAQAGEIVYLPYGAAYSNEVLQEETEYYQIDFLLFEGQQPVSLLPEIKTFPREFGRKLLPEVEQIYDTYISHRPGRDLLCAAGVLKLLAALREGDGMGQKQDKAMEKIQRSVEYIREHFTENTSVEELAAMSYTCVSNLELAFRKCLGMTPIAYRNKLRMDYARRLLAEGLSIEEAAKASGFKDYFYFSRQFKKETGMTPGQYKGSMLW